MDGNWTVPGYRHVCKLGEGASGTVILAVHETTGAPAAIKYLSDRLWSDETFLRRFRSEARLMSELDDPNLVRFYEYVESPQAAALVMELVDGVTLKEILKSEGETGPEAALLVLKGSLLGLAAAHAVGVVHRDYKPGNVLVNDDGASKLADFGIAVRAGEQATASGTPSYMAPEQWTTGAVSPATDVYAATAVFYECLTGECPYPVTGMWALAAAHRMNPIPVDRVPPPLRGLVEQGLAKDFADRPPSAVAFLAELEDAAVAEYGPGWEERGRMRLAALAALLASLFPRAQPITMGSTALALTRFGRRRLTAVAGVAVGALTVGGGGLFALGGVHHHLGQGSAVTSTPTAAIGPGETLTPADSPSPKGSGSVALSPTPTATDSPTPEATPSPTKTTAPAPKPTPTKVTALKVSSVTVTAPQGNETEYTATATVTITITGLGTVSVGMKFTSDTGLASTASPQKEKAGSYKLIFTGRFGTCPGKVVTATASAAGRQASGSSEPIQCLAG